MGNIYRYVEPVTLYLLKLKGRAYWYELGNYLQEHALTDSEVDRAALYRTLRQLETNGFVTSEWDVGGGGPARRLYALTPAGMDHLSEWLVVLRQMAAAMNRFVDEADKLILSDKKDLKMANTVENE
jgi:DNA-binding PadR family transcriptional regulator